MKFYRNTRRFSITIPRRPAGGQIILQPNGSGKDVVEGSYYEQYTKGREPLLERLEEAPEDLDSVVYSQTEREKGTKPISSTATTETSEPETEESKTEEESETGDVAPEDEGSGSEGEEDLESENPESDALASWKEEHGGLSKTNLSSTKNDDLEELMGILGLEVESSMVKDDMVRAILESQE